MSRTSPAGTPLGDEFHLYDTTLRDGAQREGISYSVADKLAVARLLDTLGVGFIEGGWPGALPKDTEFFHRAAAGELALQHAVLVAFGSTRRAALTAAQDPQVQALLASRAPVVTLVAKADRRHVERALRVDVAQACAMVADTVALLVDEGRRVFLDAEHFFDGYAFDADCALRVLEAGVTVGADVVVLCDTNGGQLPLQLAETVTEVVARTGFRVGIHCQDDTACAVANTVAAVQAGATHVQCTANGYGERTGNADLFAVIGNLATKLGMPVLPEPGMAELTRASHALESYRVIVDHTMDSTVVAQATVTVHVAGDRVLATAEGNGPVNALDGALRQALGAYVPWLGSVSLSDYKVRILPGTSGTDAVTRVLVDTSDGAGSWTTVGVHGNVVEASWLALLDAMTYAALRHHGVASTA